jgi:hypothetical protein
MSYSMCRKERHMDRVLNYFTHLFKTPYDIVDRWSVVTIKVKFKAQLIGIPILIAIVNGYVHH